MSLGGSLPPITKRPDEVALFVFSAATWNPHRIHYDRDHARSEGHKDLAVHGSLQANWLIEAMESWFPGATLTSFSFRNVATAFVNESFVVGGHVAAAESDARPDDITLDLSVEGPNGITTFGRGTLRVHTGDDGRDGQAL